MAKDDEIDGLFQLPLAEFTVARNALARSAGKDGAAIKALTKPPLAAWAVNQLFWQDRDHYDALIEAANEMRRTHKAVIEGKRGDLRTAGREHDAALDAALKSSLALVKDAGNPVTEATRQAILNTLRALPANEPPGRLTRALAPGGFEMLAGVEPVPASRRTVKSPQPATRPGSAPKGATRKEDARAEREAAKAREQKMALERAVRDADQRARQAEFEAARLAREATRTTRRLEEAQKALEAAKEELETAKRDAERAEKATGAADRRLRDAQAALEAAKGKLRP